MDPIEIEETLFTDDSLPPTMEVYDEEYDQNQDQNGSITIEELLISCVQARPPLWDCRLPLKNRSKTIREQLWLEVYNEFGEQSQYSVPFLMKKWRNLRDTFVRVKGENESYTASGSSAKKKRKWQFYDTMSFLKDTLTYRATVSNIGESPTTPLTSSCLQSHTFPEKEKKKLTHVDNAIVEALGKINQPLVCQSHQQTVSPESNPICQKISQILSRMPLLERTKLEIKLLQITYENAEIYL